MSFSPSVGLDGFRVVSTFKIEELSCADLNNDVYQLGVLLYPPDSLNEKFLIKLRDCVVKLVETHPLKRWLKWISKPNQRSEKIQKKTEVLRGIIQSQFNLITDSKVKNQIIEILSDIKEDTLAEKMLKSYLYLMIGNITRSDNIIKSILNTPPVKNWEGFNANPSPYHKLAKDYAEQIITKISNHPADRRSFALLGLYIKFFYNDRFILELAGEIPTSEIEDKLSLKYTEKFAPSFVHYLRLNSKSEEARMADLRLYNLYPLSEQSYWVWAFMEIDPLISESMTDELIRLEKEDQLWFIYLMDNEKLADVYFKKTSTSSLPGRRQFLRHNLEDSKVFMLSLYKLIEFGDINQELVQKTSQFILHE